MKLFKKHSKKSDQVEIAFYFDKLEPWPTQHGTLAIQWHRGSKRGGVTEPASPESEDPRGTTTYVFDDVVIVPCTLYRTNTGDYESKIVDFQISQVDARGKPLSVLGNVAIDLAEIATLSAPALIDLPIETSNAIRTSAGGQPMLTCTVGNAANTKKPIKSDIPVGLSPSRKGPSSPAEEIEPISSRDIPSRLSTDSEDEVKPAATASGISTARQGRLDLPEPDHDAQFDSDGFLVDDDHTGEEETTEVSENTSGLQHGAVTTSNNTNGGELTNPGSTKRNLNFSVAADTAHAASEATSAAAVGGGVNAEQQRRLSGSNKASPQKNVYDGPGLEEEQGDNDDMYEADKEEEANTVATPPKNARNMQQQAPDTTMSRRTSGRRFTQNTDTLRGRRWAWVGQPNEDITAADNNETAPGANKIHPNSPGDAASSSYQASSNGRRPRGGGITSPDAVDQRSPSKVKPGPPNVKVTRGVNHDAINGNELDSPGSARVAKGWLASPTAARAGQHQKNVSADEEALDAAANELKMMAALEAAVYFAGSQPMSLDTPPNLEDMQAPARRLARTIIMLGPSSGVTFGLRAVEAIKSNAGTTSYDLPRLISWWSNVLTLRWSFWALDQTSVNTPIAAVASSAAAIAPKSSLSGSSQNDHAWATDALLPALRELESWLFDLMLEFCWTGIVLQKALAAAIDPKVGISALNDEQLQNLGDGTSNVLKTTGSVPGFEALTLEEDQSTTAINHWKSAISAADEELTGPRRRPMAPKGQIIILRNQLLLSLLNKLDSVLFAHLLKKPTEPPRVKSSGNLVATATPPRQSPARRKSEAAKGTVLPAELLPFTQGTINFTSGVALKMSVGSLSDWATDLGITSQQYTGHTSSLSRMARESENNESASSSQSPTLLLFPKLRAAADVAMMPKEALLDKQVRQEVAPGLSTREISRLLDKFQPDEAAPDAIPSELLSRLRAEGTREANKRPIGTSRQTTPSRANSGGSHGNNETASEGEVSDGSGLAGQQQVRKPSQYQPPSDTVLLAQGLVQPLNLGLSEESDDELASLEAQWSQGGGKNRYKLLRELWQGAM